MTNYVEELIKLRDENERLRKVYHVTNEDWKVKDELIYAIKNAYYDENISEDKFCRIVGKLLEEYESGDVNE